MSRQKPEYNIYVMVFIILALLWYDQQDTQKEKEEDLKMIEEEKKWKKEVFVWDFRSAEK